MVYDRRTYQQSLNNESPLIRLCFMAFHVLMIVYEGVLTCSDIEETNNKILKSLFQSGLQSHLAFSFPQQCIHR